MRYNNDGGHLIASIFGGSGKIDNMVAMNSNVNRGAYKQLENLWASTLKSGGNVKVNVSPIYAGNSQRPQKINIMYTINGRTTRVLLTNQYGG